MASKPEIVAYIVEQLGGTDKILAKKMFGEYGLYAEGKFFGLICDDKLFIKPTEEGKMLMNPLHEGSPYPSAKPHFLIEDELDNREWLAKLVDITVATLPQPKKKKRKQK